MTATGLLVTLDGPGGAGKTTTARHLTDRLTTLGHLVHPTAEPSEGELGRTARRKSDEYGGHALACLVAADRYHHLATEIRPHKASGHIVVCDRYVASSYVLQRIDGVPIEFIANLNADADVPDLAVILTAEPATTARRIEERGTRHRFETGIGSATREAALYTEAAVWLDAQGYQLLKIDTTHMTPDQVADRIAARITEPTTHPTPE